MNKGKCRRLKRFSASINCSSMIEFEIDRVQSVNCLGLIEWSANEISIFRTLVGREERVGV